MFNDVTLAINEKQCIFLEQRSRIDNILNIYVLTP